MVAALTAKWVEDAFDEGIYEENVKLSSYSYLDNEKLKIEKKFCFSIYFKSSWCDIC